MQRTTFLCQGWILFDSALLIVSNGLALLGVDARAEQAKREEQGGEESFHGREAQQNRADIELGIKSWAEHFAEQGMDFSEEMEIRAQNARALLDLAKKYNVPLELLWKPSGGVAATPAVGEADDPPTTPGDVRQPG